MARKSTGYIMGLRRWSILVLALLLPVVCFAALASSVSGPYDVGCVSAHRGFTVVLTSWKSGNSSYYYFPYGSCL